MGRLLRAGGRQAQSRNRPDAPQITQSRLMQIPENAKPIFPKRGHYTEKDQRKSDQATKFIGRGSSRSSTHTYAGCWGKLANCGQYSASDKVFISAEGDRSGRIPPDWEEIKRATDAGATIITDKKADRERAYNCGEREVAQFLEIQRYTEKPPGIWARRAD